MARMRGPLRGCVPGFAGEPIALRRVGQGALGLAVPVQYTHELEVHRPKCFRGNLQVRKPLEARYRDIELTGAPLQPRGCEVEERIVR